MTASTSESLETLPLFPLNAVVFPGGLLPLRIFETRYVDMVSRCLKSDSGFGVCLIREGSEVGSAPSVHTTGTLVRIMDWEALPDGLLGITAQGERRFTVESSRVQEDQLTVGELRLLAEEGHVPIPEDRQWLAHKLRAVLERHLADPDRIPPACFEDAGWVGFRWAELAALSMTDRQQLLEMDDPVKRLDYLAALAAPGAD